MQTEPTTTADPATPEPRVVPPAVVPWDCPEDVPLNCWVRSKQFAVHMLVVCVWPNGVAAHDSADIRTLSWKKLHESCEYSTDRRTWLPCSKPGSSAQQTE